MSRERGETLDGATSQPGSLGSLYTINTVAPQDGGNGVTDTYNYDDLGRVWKAVGNNNDQLSQTYTYDRYGNIDTNGSPQSWTPSYVSSTNQYLVSEQGCPYGIQYDGNGDLLCDTFAEYTWDSDHKITTVQNIYGEDLGTNEYDAFGRLVEQSGGGLATDFVFAPGISQPVAVVYSQTSVNATIPLPAGGGALFSPTLSGYNHADWHGNVRISTGQNQTLLLHNEYSPFGLEYDSGNYDCCNNVFDGGLPFITGAGDGYTMPYRTLHAVQGRWLSPDPAGRNAVDPANPQSWNRYAYVLNNPLSYKDPTGLWCVWEDGTHDDDPSNGGASSGDCADQGGHWDQFDTITGIFQQNGNITQINTIYGNCTTSDCGAGMSLQGFDQTLQSYSVLPNNAASTQSSWLGNILNTPWMVSWILPVWPLPPAAARKTITPLESVGERTVTAPERSPR